MRLPLALLPALAFSAAAPALAAGRIELPPAPVLDEPEMAAPPPMWSGVYAGLNAGGTWGNPSFATQSAPVFVVPGINEEPWAAGAAAAGTRAFSLSGGGFIGGAQLGYNFQRGAFLAGLEADIQGVAGNGGNAAGVSALPTPAAGLTYVTAMSVRTGLDYLGTVRGRIGYLVTPSLLIFGTGGLAYGGVSARGGLLVSVPNDAPYELTGLNSLAFSDTRTGWTAGGGVEWMFAHGWSARIDYLYYDLGSVSFPIGATTDRLGASILSATANRASFSVNGNLVRAGLNYHFDLGAL